jgi:hypothetical protein
MAIPLHRDVLPADTVRPSLSPRSMAGEVAVIPYPNGTYNGEWTEGHLVGSSLARVRHGIGKMKYFNGNEYFGSFLRDCFNGFGQYTWADGRVFKGHFKDDKINGEGVGEWPDGRRYEGDYVNDRAEGRGLVTLPDGRLFEGRLLLWQSMRI